MDKDNLTWATKHWDTAQKSLCQYSLGKTLFRIMRMNRFKTLKITPGLLCSMRNWSWKQLLPPDGKQTALRQTWLLQVPPCLTHWIDTSSPNKKNEKHHSHNNDQSPPWLYPQVKCNQYTEIWVEPKHSFHSLLHYLNLIVTTVTYYEDYHKGIQSKSPHYEK